MDAIVEGLDSVTVSKVIPNDPSKPHPRFSHYKNRERSGESQEQRRKLILEHQKQRRDDFLNVARALVDGDADEDDDDDDEEEEMDVSLLKGRPLRKNYRNQLMLSEWLVEVPDGFESEWNMVIVPVGKRNLVVAGRGQTKYYSRSGRYLGSFPSGLPGGCRGKNKINNSSYTLLDCIYSEKSEVFYILDVMVWDGFSYYDCETDFRFFWIRQKLSELSTDIGVKTRTNPYQFKAMPVINCDEKEKVRGALMNPEEIFPNEVTDGILFYHRKVHYLPGVCPLVGWLKGYMITELLGFPVSQILLDQRPSNYSNFKNYFVEKEQKKKKITTERKPD